MKRPFQHSLGLASLVTLAACSQGSDPSGGEVAAAPATGPALQGAIVTVPLADQEHIALELGRLEPATWAPERLTYGRVVSDPARVATLRAPLAGTLLAGEVAAQLGASLEAGAVVFRLSPRWSPQERADLTSRGISARADLAAQEAAAPALARALERARMLNAEEKSVSDRELEDTELRAQAAAARLAGARDLVRTLEAVGTPDEADALALVLPNRGEVVELLARPGEPVEAGAMLLRVEDFGAPLASIDLPLDGSVTPDVSRARVSPAGAPEVMLAAERVGLDPAAGTAGLSSAVLFRVAPDTVGVAGLRPGLALVAWLPTGQPVRAGYRVPHSAVVRLGGESFVYVRRGEEDFERRTLGSARAVEGGWFVEADWAGEGPVALVVQGAQNLLSFELLGRQGEGEEE